MVSIVAKEISHSYQEYDKQHVILEGINLEVSLGESICIMGASGSGKSTLLSILSGLLQPNQGEVLYDDVSMRQLTCNKRTAYRSQHIGFMFQNQHFFPELSVIDNVSLPLRILAKPNAKEQAKAMLNLMQLDTSLYTRYPYELSGGEQARAGLARGLIHSPSVLFADEPTSALDDHLTHQIFNDIKKLQKKLGFIIVVATHDASLKQYFNQTYQLKSGKLESL